MLLSVITPDTQPGMARMLEKELDGIDAEIIINNWDDGLKEARGDYVCLLEENSAISPGTIRDNLKAFTDKPAYRKLAMVSPFVDMPEPRTSPPVHLGYSNGVTVNIRPRTGSINPTRVGMAIGAVIRTSSLRKAGIPLANRRPLLLSAMLSIYFWENGLRINLNPETLYYMPEMVAYGNDRQPKLSLTPSEKVQNIWQHEMIS